jgi:hypothetical protein
MLDLTDRLDELVRFLNDQGSERAADLVADARDEIQRLRCLENQRLPIDRRQRMWERIWHAIQWHVPDNLTDADLYGIARMLGVEWTETH